MKQRAHNMFERVIACVYTHSAFLILIYLIELVPIIRYSTYTFIISKYDNGNETLILMPFLTYISSVDNLDQIFNQSTTNETVSCGLCTDSNASFSQLISLTPSDYYKDSNCLLSPTLIYVLLPTTILMLVFLIRLTQSPNPKTKMTKWLDIFSVNFCNLNLRTFSHIYFFLLANYTILFCKYINSKSSQILSLDMTISYIHFVLCLIYGILFLIIHFFYIHYSSFYSLGYPYDHKIHSLEMSLSFLKIISSIGSNARTFHLYHQAIFFDAIFVFLLFAVLIREMFFNLYLINIELNSLKLFCLCCSLVSVVVKLINKYFSTYFPTGPSEVLLAFDYLVIIIIPLCAVIYKGFYQGDGLEKVNLTSSMRADKEKVNLFIENVLKYLFQQRKDERNLKQNSNLKKNLMKYLNGLQWNIWRCNHVSKSTCLCNSCRVFEKYTRLNPNSTKYLNHDSNFILISIFKFLKTLESKGHFQKQAGLLKYSEVHIINYFYLKCFILEKLFGKNLFKLLSFIFRIVKNFPHFTRLNLIANHFKDELKEKYADLFPLDPKQLAEEKCKLNLLEAIDLLQDMLISISFENIHYQQLINGFIKIGSIRKKFKHNMDLLSKSIAVANKVYFVLYLSMYKFIFNQAYDVHLDLQYVMSDYVSTIEAMYQDDNMLVLQYDLTSRNLLIQKTPVSPEFKNIFTQKTLLTQNSTIDKIFPNVLRAHQIYQLVDILHLENRREFLKLVLIDTQSYLLKMIFKIKVCLSFDGNFMIFCNLHKCEDNSLFAIDNNGSFIGVSRQFALNYYFTPQILNSYPRLNIKDLLTKIHYEGKCIYNSMNDKTYSGDLLPGYMLEIYSEDFFNSLSLKISTQEKELTIIGKKGNLKPHMFIQDQDISLQDKYFFYMIKKQEQVKNKDNDYDIATEINSIFDEMVDHNPSIMNTLSSSSRKSENSVKGGAKKEKENKRYIATYNKVKNYCRSLIILNIIGIIIGIIFLYVIQNQGMKIKKRFEAIESFQSTTSMLYNQIIASTLFLTMRDDSNNYSSKDFKLLDINPSADRHFKINLAPFLKYDYQSLLSLYSSSMRNMSAKMYDAYDSDFIREYIDIDCEFFIFSGTKQEGYEIINQSLLKLFDYYFNLLLPIAKSEYLYFGTDVMNLANNSSFIVSMNQHFLSINDNSIERNWNILWINFFRNIHQNVNNVFDRIFNDQCGSINYVKLLFFSFMGVVMLIQMVINVILVFMIKVYRNQALEVIGLLIGLESTIICNTIKKLKYLKQFINLEKQPTKLMKKLESLNSKDKNNKHNSNILDQSEQEPRMTFVVKDSKDSANITYEFNRVNYIIIVILIGYFFICFLISNNSFTHIINHLPAMVNLYYSIRYSIDSICYVTMSVMLNKTNLDEDYFQQKLSTETFDQMSKTYYIRYNSLMPYLHNQIEMPLLNELFSTLKGKALCDNLVIITRNLRDDMKFDETSKDIEDTMKYLCKTIPILQTDITSILSYYNKEVRYLLHRLIDMEKTRNNLKALLDSNDMFFLHFSGGTFLSNILTHCSENIVIPTFNNNLNNFLEISICVFTLIIVINILLLFVIKKVLLNKLLMHMESLNAMIGIASK